MYLASIILPLSHFYNFLNVVLRVDSVLNKRVIKFTK